MALDIQPLTPERWDDLVQLFGDNGAYGNCWCTWFRQTSKDFSAGCANRGAGNRDFLQRLTDARRRPGLIAYRDGTPVGWVSVAPLDEFGRILRSPTLKPETAPPPTTWAIVCFYVPRGERRGGVTRSLLPAAVDYARSQGATRVEAYPVDTRGKARIESAGLFTGKLDWFQQAGFAEVRRRSLRQPVVARDL